MVRVAVLDKERCRPKNCSFICRRFCPPVRNKIEAIRIGDDGKPLIIEVLCVGCGICVRKCPFQAISIVNLPDEIGKDCAHRFGMNTFRLYRLPIPIPFHVTGLLGKNGVGKTTALNILAGIIKPNLGSWDSPPEWPDIVKHFSGSVLQDHFKRIMEKKLNVVYKPQYVDRIPSAIKGKVQELLDKVDERGVLKDVVESLELKPILDRSLEVLSGGELQRVAVAAVCLREADLYLFDEPSSYLDVRQRLAVARLIRSLALEGKTIIVSEHDIAVLDYLSDQICIFYGIPGTYGIVSAPHGVREGINLFLEGYLPDENVRFRQEAIRFHLKPPREAQTSGRILYSWEELEKSLGNFHLVVSPGDVQVGEVIGILGPNGIGKTTFLRMLAGLESPDKGVILKGPTKISYKPQYISAEYSGTVEALLRSIAGEKFESSFFKTEVLEALSLQRLLDRSVDSLSGGELQKTAIAACLIRDADLYLLDEPSAYLDVEERYGMTKVVKRIVEAFGKAAIVVEHDIVVQDFLADRLMIFSGKPGLEGFAGAPVSLRLGMNAFLKELSITFRRDPSTGRPRVNKEGSKLDRAQKASGEYYYLVEAEGGGRGKGKGKVEGEI
ncbi:ribosome biogenesis/translation initiation ATPase RLI [Candidatus Bathyarchaeota archaeon]|nr:ribosome biogenesis/translation initiation ATPase RLI [Candidatus Bathyarchaeota archaeon]